MNQDNFVENLSYIFDDYVKEKCSSNDVIVGVRRLLNDYDDSNKNSDISRIIESQKPTIRDFSTVVLRDNAIQEESIISDIKWIKLESEEGKLTIQCARFKPF